MWKNSTQEMSRQNLMFNFHCILCLSTFGDWTNNFLCIKIVCSSTPYFFVFRPTGKWPKKDNSDKWMDGWFSGFCRPAFASVDLLLAGGLSISSLISSPTSSLKSGPIANGQTHTTSTHQTSLHGPAGQTCRRSYFCYEIWTSFPDSCWKDRLVISACH